MGATKPLGIITGTIALLTVTAAVAQTPPATPAPSPGEIVAAAPPSDWTSIAPSDLLVMDLAPVKRQPRRVIIQLIPAPFSQGWVGNIRKLAAAKWWDGTSVNRVQDNYVVQWGDATERKPLPEGLVTISEADYVLSETALEQWLDDQPEPSAMEAAAGAQAAAEQAMSQALWRKKDAYADSTEHFLGWPIGTSRKGDAIGSWPVHCYGMVGVGRNLSPDTGSGAELYTVIGHAPRHLDRNIALVGRVIEGMEHLSSLPRGTGALGFYEQAKQRVPIRSVRIGSDIADLPAFEYLSTESATFARYADARANRRDPFFNVPAGGADICNIPVPVRRRP